MLDQVEDELELVVVDVEVDELELVEVDELVGGVLVTVTVVV